MERFNHFVETNRRLRHAGAKRDNQPSKFTFGTQVPRSHKEAVVDNKTPYGGFLIATEFDLLNNLHCRAVWKGIFTLNGIRIVNFLKNVKVWLHLLGNQRKNNFGLKASSEFGDLVEQYWIINKAMYVCTVYVWIQVG